MSQEFIRKHEPYAIFLTEEQKREFEDGKFTMRVYEGVPVLDYRQEWGELCSQPWWLDFMKDHKIVPSYLEARWSAIENGEEK